MPSPFFISDPLKTNPFGKIVLDINISWVIGVFTRLGDRFPSARSCPPGPRLPSGGCVERPRESGVAIALCRFPFFSGNQRTADLTGEVDCLLQLRASFQVHGVLYPIS
jgi:hypothetical protein